MERGVVGDEDCDSSLIPFLRENRVICWSSLLPKEMRSKVLFLIGYFLLFGSFLSAIVVFASPTTVFSLPKGTSPDLKLQIVDFAPTIVFLAGVGFLLAGQLKQRSEKVEEL